MVGRRRRENRCLEGLPQEEPQTRDSESSKARCLGWVEAAERQSRRDKLLREGRPRAGHSSAP